MKRSATKAEAITPTQYRAFQEAYDFFNAELFAGSLPHVLVTLQRHANALGYFSPDRFTARTEKAATLRKYHRPPCLQQSIGERSGFCNQGDRQIRSS